LPVTPGSSRSSNEINAPGRSNDQGALIWAALQCRSRPLNFRKVIGDETEKWAKVVKFSRAKPD
jgi:hypothetical protein